MRRSDREGYSTGCWCSLTTLEQGATRWPTNILPYPGAKRSRGCWLPENLAKIAQMLGRDPNTILRSTAVRTSSRKAASERLDSPNRRTRGSTVALCKRAADGVQPRTNLHRLTPNGWRGRDAVSRAGWGIGSDLAENARCYLNPALLEFSRGLRHSQTRRLHAIAGHPQVHEVPNGTHNPLVPGSSPGGPTLQPLSYPPLASIPDPQAEAPDGQVLPEV